METEKSKQSVDPGRDLNCLPLMQQFNDQQQGERGRLNFRACIRRSIIVPIIWASNVIILKGD